MSFINPYFLLAAAAVAGPVLLHLLLRNRPKRQVLPTLRFLPNSAQQSMSMHRFKNVLLLVLRSLAIVLLVAAFARPYIAVAPEEEKKEQAKTGVVFAVDASLSMRANGRWDSAMGRVATYAKTLPDGTPMALILFDQSPRIACSVTTSFADIDAALSKSAAGYGATDVLAAVRAAIDLAGQLDAESRKIVAISDFQATGLKELAPNLAIPPSVELITSPIDEENLWNATVVSAGEADEEAADRRRVRVQMAAYGEGGRTGTLRIRHGGSSLAEREVTLRGASGLVEEFELPLEPEREAILSIALDLDDALREDNEYAALLESRGPLPLLICGDSAGASPAGPERAANPYLAAAIAAFGRKVNASWTRPEGLGGVSTVEHPVAIIEAIESCAPAGWDAMKQYATAGGSLVVFPSAPAAGVARGQENAADTYRQLCGVTVEGWEELSRRTGEYRLVSSRDTHGVLPAIDQAGGALLGYPKVFRYLKAVLQEPSESTRALMGFDDGSPFLVEHRLGAGTVYLFTVPLESKSSDLVLRAAFTPFLYQLVDHCLHEGRTETYFTAGAHLPVEGGASAGELTGPDGARITLGGSPAVLAMPGVYGIRQGASERHIAVHTDGEESDLTVMPAARIASLARASTAALASRGLDARTLGEAPPDPDAAGSYWWYLLLAAMGLLVVESAIASRTSR
ncbi:MAG: BatA and WFA domain-containing protein [Candidatus Hydrogenedentes bacterium]|nr:BatA and WFA domain-containing protein [Candidatus Hydrogenedentota bacterium]